MEKLTIQEKSRNFAIRIINCYKFLDEQKHERIMSKQMLRSGTSIGANIRESRNAQSRADFLSKLNIALKEADETAYWLDLLCSTDYLDDKIYGSLDSDCTELIKMLTAIIKKLKESPSTVNYQLSTEESGAQVARKGGEIAGDARAKLEAQVGHSVISKEKASDYLPPADRWKELPEEDSED